MSRIRRSVQTEREREIQDDRRSVFARAVCVSLRSRVTTCVRERREEEARKGSPRFGLLSVPLGIGIISLSLSVMMMMTSFTSSGGFATTQNRRANFDSNECENQRKDTRGTLFYHRIQQREKRRKDEDEKRVMMFFVFVACTTTRFSRTKEGVY